MTICRRLPALVSIIALCLPALAGAADGRLDRLVQAQAVSGFERDAREAIAALLPPWAHPTVDEAGNLVLTIGRGQPHLLVVASIDEDGYLVSDITEDGYLRLTRVSTGAGFRLFDQFIYGQPVVIRTAGVDASPHAMGAQTAPRRTAYVPGVVATLSTHLQRGRDASTAIKGLDDIWVDMGASTRADVEKLGIRLLDTVGLRERVQHLAGGRTTGVAAQARGAALALIDLAGPSGATQPPTVTGTLTIAWATQGLFGDRGIARLAQTIRPDRVVLVSRGTTSRDADAKGTLGRLGGGPVVPETDAALIDIARRAGVTVQTVPALRGTNAWPATPVQKVALPVLFKDTPVETVQDDDIAGMARLLRAATGLAPDAGSAGTAGRSTAGQGGASPAARPLSGVFALLAPLVETYGVSGHETAVREAVAKRLPAWARPEVDARGNLTVSFGTGGQQLLFVAHTDELGYEITGIQEDGTATVRKRGGFFDSLLEAHPVIVHTARGQVGAVVAPRPNYQRATESQPKPDEVVIEFGTTSRQQTEALGVAKGDAITVRKQFTELTGNRGTARAIDDRAGCAALLAALAAIDPAKVTNRITFAWVVEEETGLAGSGVLAERLHPAYAFAVDTFVSSDSPVDPQRMAHILLGTGAVLRAVDNSSITPPATVAEIRAMARARGIPTTVGVTSGGNDGSQFSRMGSIVVPISWPGRYSHSAVEVVDRRDLDALVHLIVMLVGEFPGRS
jgi:putative aminopeptidase